MSQTTEALLDRIDQDIEATRGENSYGTVDLWILLQCLAIDIIGETAFGQSFHTLNQSNHFVPATIDSFTKAGTYVCQEKYCLTHSPAYFLKPGRRPPDPRIHSCRHVRQPFD